MGLWYHNVVSSAMCFLECALATIFGQNRFKWRRWPIIFHLGYSMKPSIIDSGMDTPLHNLAKKIFPLCRSITGNGVRETFSIIQSVLPELKTYEIPSGEKCSDWTIPPEWNITDAYVKTSSGEKVIDFKVNNLHIVNYSIPHHSTMTLAELNKHLYSLPQMPDAVPYVTRYYSPEWGFCLTHEKRQALKEDTYEVLIESRLEPGSLTYGELILKGKSDKEILVSTYTCHPSMANNETSGPVVTTFLADYVKRLDNYYTYRFVFVPETIGAVAYLSRELEVLKKNVVAGFQITCVGDERAYSYMASRKGDTLADKVIKHVLTHKTDGFKSYTFLSRGSDERQYCAPGVDLPVASLMRSKYAEYPEYHTSKDDLTLITEKGLRSSVDLHIECFKILEKNNKYLLATIGEPQLGKHGLRSNVGGLGLAPNFKLISDFLAYSDGSNDVIDIANIIGAYAGDLLPIASILLEKKLITIRPE